jgi:ABC-type transporter Mla subunit MlaD
MQVRTMAGISLATLENLLSQQTQTIIAAINKEGNTIMSTQSTSFSDIQNSLNALTAAQQKVSTDISSAVADIQALSAQVATLQGSGGATPQQLGDLKTSMDQITANLSGASTNLEAVLPVATPAPTPSS